MVIRLVAPVSAFLLLLAAGGGALADIGPKPTMAFAFSFADKTLTIAKGELLMCGDAQCSDAHPLQRLGPQLFDCGARSCSARAYGFARFGRLRITLSDGRALTSNVFRDADFNASFRVVVGADRLTVRPAK